MRKLEVLNTNYEKSGLYAKIPALNDMTLKEFFEGLNIVKNYDSVRTFNNAIETVDESILIDSSVSLISGHEYFSAFDLIFKTMPADAPDSYRLWVGSEGVTDTITHSFLTNKKEVFMNVKTAASSRTSDLYLNLFGMTIGQSMSLETDLYFIIDLTNLSFEVTEEQVYYYYRMYRYLKDSKSFDGFTYLPKGQSKYDIAYVNKTIDEPIAELNGHTLREVFEEGNQNNNNLAELSFTGYGWGYGSFDWISGDDYYIRISHKVVSDIYDGSYGLNRIIFTDGTVGLYMTQSIIDNGVYETKSFNITALTTQTTHLTLYGSSAGTSKIQYAKDIYVINKDALGISSLVDMDYYFSLYQARKNITKKVLTYVDIFEEIQELVNPNFDEGTNGWGFYVSDCGLSVQDGIATFAPAVSSTGIAQSLLQEKDTDYYFAIKGKAQEPGNIGVGFATNAVGTQIINFTITTNMEFYSQIFKSLQEFNTFVVGREVNTYTLDYIHLINKKHFDESITKEQLDTMLAHYLLVKNIVIYPEIYVPIEPVGLGNRFKLLAVDDTVYGHELDFEDISFKMYFGVNFDAYKGYHAMMNMLRSNKAIIEYDWGIGPRYNDVRLLNAPKTEKDTSLLIISKFYFKRLNPFYELIEVSDEEDMKNESDLDSPVKLNLTVSNTTVSIKLLDTSSGVQQEISFDFTGVSTPFNLTIDPETKKLLIDDITDAYDYADHTKDSFIYLPGDSEIYSINITGAAVNKITYKKWVIS